MCCGNELGAEWTESRDFREAFPAALQERNPRRLRRIGYAGAELRLAPNDLRSCHLGLPSGFSGASAIAGTPFAIVIIVY